MLLMMSWAVRSLVNRVVCGVRFSSIMWGDKAVVETTVMLEFRNELV